MRHARVILFCLCALLFSGCDAGPAHVIVGTIAEPVPIGTDAETIEIKFPDFWTAHCDDEAWKKENERAQSETQRDWRAKYGRYSQALIAQAAKAQLDSVSLSNVLKTILADGERQRKAYLPFAAYSAVGNGEPVWVVDLAWEGQGDVWDQLGHIRAYAITAKDLNQVGFFTCR